MNLKPQFEKVQTAALLVVGVICLSTMSALAANETNAVAQTQPAALSLRARTEAGASETLKLRGSDARQQLLATMRLTNGALRDVTRAVSYDVTPASIVKVDKGGARRSCWQRLGVGDCEDEGWIERVDVRHG